MNIVKCGYSNCNAAICIAVVEGQSMALQNQLVKHFLSKTQGVIPVMNNNGTNTGTKSTLVSSLRLQRH